LPKAGVTCLPAFASAFPDLASPHLSGDCSKVWFCPFSAVEAMQSIPGHPAAGFDPLLPIALDFPMDS
jgi:hypothetical protein